MSRRLAEWCWSVLVIWQGATSKMEAYVEQTIELVKHVHLCFGYALIYNGDEIEEWVNSLSGESI